MADKISCRMNRVGGQAVLEGVMMKGGDNVALAVRREDKTIALETSKHTSVRKKYKILNLPVVRGAVNMVETMMLSYATLGQSAKMLGIDDAEPETKFEKWMKEKLGDALMNVIMSVAAVLGVVLALFLFKFIPTVTAGLINRFVPIPGALRTLIEGVIKIGIFVAYIALCGLMPDIKRTFEYHGAEHKSIACYESGMELTPENASKCTRFHPRCGTSFIFVVLIISIIVFSFLPWGNVWIRLGLQLLFLPIVIGLSFEFIMYSGKHQNFVTVLLSAPGLGMQRITTKEPTLDQLEVAITSLKAALPDEFPPEVKEAEAETETESVAESDEKPEADAEADMDTEAEAESDDKAEAESDEKPEAVAETETVSQGESSEENDA